MTILERSVIAIFCEDIREEVNGTNTIVGTLPDTVAVQAPNGLFPKLAVYMRLAFEPRAVPLSVTYGIRFAGKAPFTESEIAQEILKQAAEDTQKAGTVVATVIARLIASPFPVEIGQLQAYAILDGEEVVAGSLNFALAEES